MFTIVDVEKLGRKEWRDYLLENPVGNIFQSPEIYDVYKIDYSNRSLGVALLDDERICGLVIGNYTDYFGVASRLSIQGGPICDKIGYVPVLLSSIENLFGRFNLTGLVDIKNMWDSSSLINVFNGANYLYEDHLNYIIDLSSSENVWSSISKNRRKNIRHAMKKGFIIKDASTRKDVVDSYRLIKNTYNRVSMPVPDAKLFHNALSFLKGSIIWRIAYLSDEPVATRIFLTFRDTIYDWYASSLYGENAAFSNELMVWNILEYGCERGFKFFDFGGAGNPAKPYGPREFKRRFGGRQVNFGKYTRVKNDRLFSIAKSIMSFRYKGLNAQI